MRWLLACALAIAAMPIPVTGQEPTWRVDLGATTFVEGWNQNEDRDALGGAIVGGDWQAWRGLAIRGEGLIASVRNDGNDARLGGITIGTRVRWRAGNTRPFADVAVGWSKANHPVPFRGTSSNYVALAGGGIEMPFRGLHASLAGRWLHLSNNGRRGRARNPDIQGLGFIVAVGWSN